MPFEWSRWLLLGSILVGASPALAHPGPSAALRSLDERIAATPNDVALRLRRAELRRSMGHPRDALADLRVASRLDPTEREVWLEHALTLIDLGKPQAAERELTRVIEAGPPHVRALAERAHLREADGRLELARHDLDAAIAVDQALDLYLARGHIDERLDHLDAAAAGYREGLAALGPAVLLRLALADVERRRGAHEQALAVLDGLLAENPSRADWVLRRADVLQDAGLSEAATAERMRALVLAHAAVQRRPTPLHRLVLAKAHLALGQRERARKQLALVLEQAPALPEARTMKAHLDESLAPQGPP
ncbi:tetratricopeptide repeat protein [Paraliomyxa miuraensis]|uniref:tetratricopeptide repeat protein n=1 Tax=Paraliomyxa miuraensis TaxID=376150 RepID=UPI00225B6007|nr:hypothetical protein [Paraliomyxa miuraensis]MCX4244944.1 hypothetical protein [Paraliomyxa miuraensis]